jgi:hypothetical protein
MRRALAAWALVAAVAALAAAPASAQTPLPPSLSADLSFAPPTGIGRTDFAAGTIADVPTAVAVDGDRIYTVGRTQGGSGGQDVGIIARKADGSFDTGFSGDGKLIVAIAPTTENDAGTGIVVLPDHRIRVIAATDIATGSGESLDVALLGFNADGSPDTTFGALDGAGPGRTGRVVFPAGPSSDVPARIVAGPGGRLGIIGSRSDGSRDDVFVSLREADGSPVTTFGVNGVKFINRGGGTGADTLIDRGVDLEFRPGGGVLALMLVATKSASPFDFTSVLHAFTATGADDPSFSDDGDMTLAVGTPETVPGGLVEYGGRYYVAGYTRVGADTDAYLVRVNANGSGFESRLFDMRGRVVAPDQPVVSRAIDLAVVPGAPTTLVAAGSIDWGSDTGATATDWAAAAFNNFEGPLASAGFGDIVMQAPGQGGLLSVAAGPGGWAAVAGTHVDNSIADNSFGNARLLIDADKRCDLAMAVAEPAEVTFFGRAASALTSTVTNVGSRACGGTVSVAAPYRMATQATGNLAPGASFTAARVPLAYDGLLKPEDAVRVTVSSAADTNAANNVAAAHVVFRYCDLAVTPVGRSGLIPTEGARKFPVTLRNEGTTECRVKLGRRPSYELDGGKSVSDRAPASAPAGAEPGSRVGVLVSVPADGDVDPADNAAARNPLVVRVGDSDIRRAGARRFAGSASRGKGEGASRRQLRARKVHVAVMRVGDERCGWLKGDSGRFTSRPAGEDGGCGARRWVRADGVRHWRLRLDDALDSGDYVVYSRTTIGAGFPEARFSRADGNRVRFHVG